MLRGEPGSIPLFEINPELDRERLSREFKTNRRVQIRDILTLTTAHEIHEILARRTPWSVAWQAGKDGPHVIGHDDISNLPETRLAELRAKLSAAARGEDYAFFYSTYPMLQAYLEKWNEAGPHDLILEHINSGPFLDLVREVAGMPELLKADAQATLYAPGQFLTLHDDSDATEGRRLAYVLNMTLEPWRPDWGGYLLFYSDEDDVIAGFRPRFNALNIFEVPQRHNVTYVPPFSPLGRLAITGWFLDR